MPEPLSNGALAAPVPTMSLPVCGFCKVDPVTFQTAFCNMPWGAKVAVFHCMGCRAVLGTAIIAMIGPPEREPLLVKGYTGI